MEKNWYVWLTVNEIEIREIRLAANFPFQYMTWTVKEAVFDEDAFIRASVQHPTRPEAHETLELFIDPLDSFVWAYQVFRGAAVELFALDERRGEYVQAYPAGLSA